MTVRWTVRAEPDRARSSRENSIPREKHPTGALVSFIKRRESNGFGSEGDSEGALEKVKGVFTDKP